MVVKKKLAAALAVVGLALVALLQPAAAAGLKFEKEDVQSEESLWSLYERWGARYNRARDPADKVRRFDFFKATVHRVIGRSAGQERLGLNGFADLSEEEFGDYTCLMPDVDDTDAPPVKRRGDGTLPLPDSIDWRHKGCGEKPCLGPVKHQGRCGSCWAFAATAPLESHYAIQGMSDPRLHPIELSEQELVDCDDTSHGCKGGLATHAFRYVANKGLSSSSAYPYTGVACTCQSGGKPRVDMVILGYHQLPTNDEFQLLQTVAYGPVAVSIAVGKNNTDFRDYEGGIYRKKCGTVPDHKMLLVGYDSQVYVLQNSHGDEWGDDGFLILPRDSGDRTRGTCSILVRRGSYPVAVL